MDIVTKRLIDGKLQNRFGEKKTSRWNRPKRCAHEDATNEPLRKSKRIEEMKIRTRIDHVNFSI